MHRLLRRVVDVEPGEVRPMLLACLYFFFIFTSYFILRPIRDEMAVASGARDLKWLFLGTLVAMAVANPLYSALVSRFPVRRFITITYQFFALCLLLFYFAWRSGGEATVTTGRLFFAWTSVFNLFVVTVFWSLMADTFRTDQAKRLFGFIGVGGTLGSISGSAITGFLADNLGVANLLLVSAALLQVAVGIALIYPSRAHAPAGAGGQQASAHDERRVIGGSTWAGVVHVFRSPYLLGIAGYLLLFVFGSTTLYTAQTEIIGQFYQDRAARTEILGRMEMAAQSLAAIVQIFVTGHVLKRFGVTAALAIVPVLSIVGFAAIGVSSWGLLPILPTFMALSILRRGMEYSLGRPAREVLYTVVSREDKYKAKSFNDTFVYRTGDQIAIWIVDALLWAGLALAGVSWVTVVVSVLFLVLALWLGRHQQQRLYEATGNERVDIPTAAPLPAR